MSEQLDAAGVRDATLLNIPRELRDQILGLVVATHRAAPQDISLSTPPPQARRELHDIEYKSWRRGYDVKYEVDIPGRAETIPTLLVNKQLMEETLKAIQDFREKHSYEMDIMLLDEQSLWPTWLHLLEHTTRIDTIHATVRICGSYKKGHSSFRIGCGSPPGITWCFYSLLERILQLGPPELKKNTVVTTAVEEKHGKGVSIKNLDLEFVSPDPSKYTVFPPLQVRGYYITELEKARKNDGIDYVMNSCSLLKFVESWIITLLEMGYHTAEYGRLLFERVGHIRLFLDGTLRKEIDLAELLEERSFDDSFGNYPREERETVFKAWKVEARKTRIALGLKVLPLDDEKEDGIKDAGSKSP